MKAARHRRLGQMAAWVALGAGVLAILIRLAVGLDAVIFAPIVGAAALAGLALGRSRGEGGMLAAYFVALALFTQLRDAADETGLPTFSAYVIDWELWMFGGVAPSAWLQGRIGGVGPAPGFLAYVSAVTHWLWFVFPHATVVGVYLFARRMSSRVIVIVLATFYVGVMLYFVAPTAPPWMASEQGLLAGIVRGMDAVGPAILGASLYSTAFDALAEPNPTAAMPSLHFAASFVVVLVGLMLRSRVLTGIAVFYSAALAFALIYLGEHYFADIISGAVVAFAAFFAVELARGAYLAAQRRRTEISAGLRRWEERAREALRLAGRRIEAS